ncbi:Bax inhibitor-1/YccA family protein [Lentisphaerota bacterium WC36G]|nr:Bax inhibitor-1/YccA family protein [Lentisphaerae bacterium WC36]
MRRGKYDGDYYSYGNESSVIASRQSSLTLMNKVYLWMTGALALSAISAFLVLRDEALLQRAHQSYLALALIEIGLVIGLSWLIDKMTAAVAGALFGVYSVLSGITLGVIVSMYAQDAILPAFIASGGTFLATSVYGYITKKDLSSVGSFCIMALIGLIIASLLNLFFRSPMAYWLITYLMVFVFIGLTAWDTQKIKELSAVCDPNDEESKKIAILGALSLYLDFINLFILFLRIFGGGGRRD